MKNLCLLVIVAFLVSCAHKVKVMNAAAVSMTHDSVRPGETLSPMGPVSGEFCPDTRNDQGSIGLFDEAVKNAQSKSQVDFIMNASFWAAGTCISVEGDGAKVVSATESVKHKK